MSNQSSHFVWRIILLIVVIVVSWGATAVALHAQENPDDNLIPLVHEVQEGETLTYIAGLYGVTVEQILLVNNMADGDFLYLGQQLIIPGVAGEAVATFYIVQPGDTLPGLATAFNTSIADLLATNRTLNPNIDLTVGQQIGIISRTGSAEPQAIPGQAYIVQAGDTLTGLAARYQVSATNLAAVNDLPYPAYLYAGQRLRIPTAGEYRDLPGEWTDIQIRPLPLQQGATASIYVENLLDGQPSGQFAGQTLYFMPYETGYVALIGLDAFTEPGNHTLELTGSGNRPWTPFRQDVPVRSSNYGQQYIAVADDPEVRANEDAFLFTIYTQFRPEQLWEGLFQYPVTSTIVTAGYGDARSYDGGPFDNFHTGVDLGGGIGTPILAPTSGEVVFTGLLDLRGNTVIVDHGLGVMTAYFHLSEISVNVGDQVTTGQQLGLGGNTGLSTGPHLHWDLRIMNVPVDGRQWTQVAFP